MSNDILSNMALATQGQSGIVELTNVLATQVKAQIIKEVSEGFARQMYMPDDQLKGTKGLKLRFPVKDRSTATQIEDKATVLITQGVLDGVEAEVKVVAARAEWSVGAIESGELNLIAEEIEDAKNAIMEFEVAEVVARLTADFDPSNTFAAATAGTFAYADIITARQTVRVDRFRLDRIGVHPDQMGDLLNDNNLIDADLLPLISPSGDQMWNIAKLGIMIIESTEFASGTAFGWDSKKAGRIAIKKEPTVQVYNGAAVGQLVEGALIWEMIDTVTTRPKAIVRITGA